MPSMHLIVLATAALVVGLVPLVAGHEESVSMSMDMGTNATMTVAAGSSATAPLNYFRHPHYAGWMYAHTSLMIVGWTVTMPVAIMLSCARSRYHLPAQLLFHAVNGLGAFTAFVYNHATPDLYKQNSHHPIGWIATAFTITWTVMSLFVAYSERKSKRAEAVPTHHAHYDRLQQYRDSVSVRTSRDSGHGTDRNSMSLMGSRQSSRDSLPPKPHEPAPLPDPEFDDHEEDAETEKHGLLGNNKVDRFVSRNVRRFASPRASKVVRFCQIVAEKLLLLMGFLAITTGFVVYGGVFRDREIFSGLAHFIKGGIFFWYGLLSLGRWMGAFTEFGWAWNIRPKYPMVARWKSRVPSAEFTESFVIWLYGCSNVFLEHLNATEWSPQDLEHVSITLLFFGGGLLGMMIESSGARDLMNTTVELQKKSEVEGRGSGLNASEQDSEMAPPERWTPPASYQIPLNPMPGLVIMLLGVMMSSHHQSSMVSTMLHAQWGSLFVAFAMARAATYITLYVKPPTSHYPSRPPSELVASFCLVAGGLMFMISARDMVVSIEENGLEAMAIFTVTMGLAGLIMAWEVCVYALKGWATRKERS